MDILSTGIVDFLNTYGYPAAALIMAVTGAGGAIIGGFFAGLGVFKVVFIYLLSVGIDITSDIFYYEVGRRGGRKILTKYAHVFSWSEKLMAKAEWLFQKHGRKTLFIAKFTQGLGVPTQLMAGLGHMPRKFFILANLLGGAVKSAVLVFIGYIAGESWQIWVKRVEDVALFITAAVIVSVVGFIAIKKYQRWLNEEKLSNQND